MKKSVLHILLFLVSVSFNLYSQKLRIINTKDFVRVADTYGVDSALNIWQPEKICYLDTLVAKKLAARIAERSCSEKTEAFLLEFCQIKNITSQSEILNNFIKRKISQIDRYEPANSKMGLPLISKAEMIFITMCQDRFRENLLIDYYNAWLKKAEIYKTNRKKKRSFSSCHENCYRLLLSLDKIGSSFSTIDKRRIHDNLRNTDGVSSLIPEVESRNIFKEKYYSIKDLKLAGNYKSISEIDFQFEPELQKILAVAKQPKCSVYILFNLNVGFIYSECYYGPLSAWGSDYKIVLVNQNTLRLYCIERWMS